MFAGIEVADIAIAIASVDIDMVIGFEGWKKKIDEIDCFVFDVAVVNAVIVVVGVETGVVRLYVGYYLLDQYQMSQVNLHHY